MPTTSRSNSPSAKAGGAVKITLNTLNTLNAGIQVFCCLSPILKNDSQGKYLLDVAACLALDAEVRGMDLRVYCCQ